MTYGVRRSDKAQEQIRTLAPRPKREVRAAILLLDEGPHAADAKNLDGFDTLWRVRVGGWRIIFDLDEEQQLITILRVARREVVYEGLEDLVRDDPSGPR